MRGRASRCRARSCTAPTGTTPRPEGSYLAALTLLHDLLNVRVRGLPAQVSFGGQTLVSLSAEMAEAMQRLVQAL